MFVPFVTEKTKEGYDRQTDLFSKLLEKRIIMLTGEVCQEMSYSAIAQLLYLDSINHEPITVYINSEGGEVVSGMAIYDTFKIVKSPIHTVCTGLCASMGAVLLSGGDKRYSLPNSEIMVHQPSGGAFGQATDIKIQAELIMKTKRQLTKLLADNCGVTYEEMEVLCERDTWMDAEEAKELGIIDGIVKYSKK